MSRRPGMRIQQGFTIIEMLFTMLILGFIFAFLIRVETNTLNFSSRTQGQSNQYASLVETSGYMGDMIRQASSVVTASFSFTADSSGTSLTCSFTSTTNPCFGLVVPASQGAVSTDAFRLDTYLMLIYRVEKRSDLSSALKTTNTWADANTYVIKEYRKVLCRDNTTGTAACNGVAPTVTYPISNATSYLVGEGLALLKPDGTSYSPFTYNSTTKQFTLRLQTVYQSNSKTYYVPTTGPQSVTVRLRN